MHRVKLDPAVIKMSSLELAVVVSASFVGTFTIVYSILNINSTVAQYLAFEETKPDSTVSTIQSVQANINQSDFVADVSLFLLWMLIGMIVYIFGESVVRTAKKSKQISRDLRYAGFDKSVIIKELVAKFFTQIFSAIALYLVILATVRLIIPYVVVVLGQTQNPGFELFVQAATLFGCFLLILHICTVLLRLLLLRVRVFATSGN